MVRAGRAIDLEQRRTHLSSSSCGGPAVCVWTILSFALAGSATRVSRRAGVVGEPSRGARRLTGPIREPKRENQMAGEPRCLLASRRGRVLQSNRRCTYSRARAVGVLTAGALQRHWHRPRDAAVETTGRSVPRAAARRAAVTEIGRRSARRATCRRLIPRRFARQDIR